MYLLYSKNIFLIYINQFLFDGHAIVDTVEWLRGPSETQRNLVEKVWRPILGTDEHFSQTIQYLS